MVTQLDQHWNRNPLGLVEHLQKKNPMIHWFIIIFPYFFYHSNVILWLFHGIPIFRETMLLVKDGAPSPQKNHPGVCDPFGKNQPPSRGNIKVLLLVCVQTTHKHISTTRK